MPFSIPTSVKDAAGTLFTDTARALAQRAGVSIGTTTDVSRLPPSIQGGANRVPEPQYVARPPWYRLPAVWIGAAVLVVAVLVATRRGRK